MVCRQRRIVFVARQLASFLPPLIVLMWGFSRKIACCSKFGLWSFPFIYFSPFQGPLFALSISYFAACLRHPPTGKRRLELTIEQSEAVGRNVITSSNRRRCATQHLWCISARCHGWTPGPRVPKNQPSSALQISQSEPGIPQCVHGETKKKKINSGILEGEQKAAGKKRDSNNFTVWYINGQTNERAAFY